MFLLTCKNCFLLQFVYIRNNISLQHYVMCWVVPVCVLLWFLPHCPIDTSMCFTAVSCWPNHRFLLHMYWWTRNQFGSGNDQLEDKAEVFVWLSLFDGVTELCCGLLNCPHRHRLKCVPLVIQSSAPWLARNCGILVVTCCLTWLRLLTEAGMATGVWCPLLADSHSRCLCFVSPWHEPDICPLLADSHSRCLCFVSPWHEPDICPLLADSHSRCLCFVSPWLDLSLTFAPY